MASYIKQVSIENFFNYNEVCTYDFDQGLNILLAQNGQGKTNFINLIKWIITDQFTFSEPRTGEERVKAGLTAPKQLIYAINNKAKNECEVDDQIKSWIEVCFIDSKNIKYLIKKSIISTKANNDLYSDQWTITVQPTVITMIKGRDRKPISFEKDQEKILRKLMTPEILPYSILKGEDLDKTINFADKKAVNNTIEQLTNIKYFKDIISKADNVHLQLEKHRNKYLKENSADQERSNKLNNDIESLRTKSHQEEEYLSKEKESLKSISSKLNDLEQKSSLAEKRNEIRSVIQSLQSNLSNLLNQRSIIENSLNQNLFSPIYGLLGVHLEDRLRSYKSKIDNYRAKKAQINSTEKITTSSTRKLPIETPTSDSIKKMLHEQECWLCGTKAKEGSQEYNHIKSHLKVWDEVREKSKKNDLSFFFDKIYNSIGGQFYSQPPKIIIEREQIQIQIDKLTGQIDELENQIEIKNNELINVFGDMDESSDDNILAYATNYTRRQVGLENEINACESRLKSLEAEICRKTLELKNLSKRSSLKSEIVEGPEIFDAFIKKLKQSADSFITQLIQTLEDASNKNYQALAKYESRDVDSSVTLRFNAEVSNGELKRIDIRRYDKEGVELPAASGAYSMLTKLAVVMGIRDVRRTKNKTFNAPFIADAPTSTMQRSLTKGFFEHIPEVFSQSIIFTKDLFEQDNTIGEFGQAIIDHAKSSGHGKIYLNTFDQANPTRSETEFEEL